MVRVNTGRTRTSRSGVQARQHDYDAERAIKLD